MATSCDPEALVRLVKSGDLAALDHLTRCQGQRLLAVGRRHCRTDEEAEDAVQDALVSASTHLSEYRGDGPVDGWVIRMVARACGRMRRGRKNDPGLHAVDVDLTGDDDPLMAAQRAQVARTLEGALAELEPVDRAVLWLAEGAGWTGPEIAEKLGSTPAAVRTRLTRVRKRVRDSLGDKLEGSTG